MNRLKFIEAGSTMTYLVNERESRKLPVVTSVVRPFFEFLLYAYLIVDLYRLYPPIAKQYARISKDATSFNEYYKLMQGLMPAYYAKYLMYSFLTNWLDMYDTSQIYTGVNADAYQTYVNPYVKRWNTIIKLFLPDAKPKSYKEQMSLVLDTLVDKIK